MAFATVAASGSGQEATLTTNHSVAIPATPAVGNVLLVIIHTTGSSITVTPPDGFVSVGSPNFVTRISGQWQTTSGPWVFAKRSNGTESTPAVFTTPSTQRSTHVWMELSNVAEDALFDGIRITSATATNANPNPPVNALPTAYDWNDSDVLYLAVTTWTTAATTFTSHPSTYTGIASEKVTSQPTGIAVARKDVAALSEDPGTFTLSASGTWVALTIAIRNADNPSYPTDITQFLSEVGYSGEGGTSVTQLLSEVGYSADTKNVDITQWLSEVGYSADDKTVDVTQFLVEVAYVPGPPGNSDYYFRILRRDDDMTLVLKQSTASQTIVIGPFIDDTDFKTPETALTIANTDIKLSKNGATAVDKNSGGATHLINGEYAITLDATDTSAVGELRISVVVAGALPVIRTFQVVEEVVFDALYAVDAPGFLGAAYGDTIDNIDTNVTTIDGNVDTVITMLGDIQGATFDTATHSLVAIYNVLTDETEDAPSITNIYNELTTIENILNEITGDTFNTEVHNLEQIYNIVNDSSTNITQIMGDTFNIDTDSLENIYDTLVLIAGSTFDTSTDSLENIYNTVAEIPKSGDERTISRAGREDVTYTETIVPPAP
jgi:hypothetical protein